MAALGRSIQIRHVSAETHAVLRRRAAERGLSMQEYLVRLLDEFAAKPTIEEVLRRAGGRSGGRVGLAPGLITRSCQE